MLALPMIFILSIGSHPGFAQTNNANRFVPPREHFCLSAKLEASRASPISGSYLGLSSALPRASTWLARVALSGVGSMSVQ